MVSLVDIERNRTRWLGPMLAMLVGSTACATTATQAPACTACPSCEQGEEWIALSQDEASVERQIAEFLKRQGVAVNVIERGDDVILGLLFQTDELPPHRVIVDTVPLERSEDGQVSERAIRILLTTGVMVPPEAMLRVILLANDLNARAPLGRFIINPRDHELEIHWSYNIVGSASVHLETFYDGLLRILGAWHQTHEAFNEAIEGVDESDKVPAGGSTGVAANAGFRRPAHMTAERRVVGAQPAVRTHANNMRP